jgi:hypothetical protein
MSMVADTREAKTTKTTTYTHIVKLALLCRSRILVQVYRSMENLSTITPMRTTTMTEFD